MFRTIQVGHKNTVILTYRGPLGGKVVCIQIHVTMCIICLGQANDQNKFNAVSGRLFQNKVDTTTEYWISTCSNPFLRFVWSKGWLCFIILALLIRPLYYDRLDWSHDAWWSQPDPLSRDAKLMPSWNSERHPLKKIGSIQQQKKYPRLQRIQLLLLNNHIDRHGKRILYSEV